MLNKGLKLVLCLMFFVFFLNAMDSDVFVSIESYLLDSDSRDIPELSSDLWTKIFEDIDFESLFQVHKTNRLFYDITAKKIKIIEKYYVGIRELLQKNDNNPNLALNKAVLKKMSCDIITLLIKKWKADILALNESSYIDIFINDNVAFAKILIDAGIDIYKKNKGSFTLLHVAAGSGSINVSRMLIAKAKRENKLAFLLDTKDEQGYTPLHWSIVFFSKKSLALVKLLIEEGVDFRIKSSNDVTALEMAVSDGHSDIEIVLREAGAIDF